MSRWLAWVLMVFSTIVAIVIAIGFFLPKGWDVSRQIVIKAPPSAIHPWVNELERWKEWAPWGKKSDGTVTFEFGKVHAGKGGSFSWSGERSGAGTLTLTRAEPDKGVWYTLVVKGSKNVDAGSITYTKVPGGTKVVWHDAGHLASGFVGRYLVPTLENSLSQQFDLGLARLKKNVESGRAPGKASGKPVVIGAPPKRTPMGVIIDGGTAGTPADAGTATPPAEAGTATPPADAGAPAGHR